MFKSSTALFLALALLAPLGSAEQNNVLQLQPDAPDRYVVVKGDTLWDISGKFLKDPWRWPEIWKLNQDQIRNPHLIYPGNVVVLDRNAMRLSLLNTQQGPQSLKLEPRVRAESLDAKPIPTIPAQLIEPFLSQPLVLERGDLDGAPRIVGTEEGRVNLGPGNLAYAEGIANTNTPVWTVYRPGAELIDPETGESLGQEAIFLGTARVLRPGDPATLEIISAKREIGEGDHLIAATEPGVFAYAPHSPQTPIRARIVSLYDGRTDLRTAYYGAKEDWALRSVLGGYGEAGPYSIVTINKGTNQGIEVGHVLAMHRGIMLSRDRSVGPYYMGDKRLDPVTLPEERFGLIMVFRTFPTISYALVVQAQRPVAPGDLVTQP